jgi:hypothetical protein
MTNAIEPVGTVTLRGHVVEIDGAVGQEFVRDISRLIEDLITTEALRTKYGLQDEDVWRALETNEPLQRAVAAMKNRRVRDGSAARERAAHLFVEAPNVLGTIMTDAAASPRHRIEAARELRQVAIPGADKPANEIDRFRITINFGTAKVHRDIELTPVKHDEDDDLPTPRATGIINYTRG